MKRALKKRFVQFAAALLSCALLVAAPTGETRAASVTVDPTIRVGLFYGSTALPGANLLNDVGGGYRLGYYDANRSFQQLAQTSETAISVVKTQNVYYGTVGNWSGYYDTITSSIVVGCYHIQVPGSYSGYDQAAAARRPVARRICGLGGWQLSGAGGRLY